MIVYLASYPRSGNSLMQSIVTDYFHQLPTSLYPNNHATPFPPVTDWAVNWRKGEAIEAWVKRTRPWLVWNEWIAVYDLDIPPYTKNNRYLLEGSRRVLRRWMRLRLALEKTVYFVKTHELPYPRFLPGERVLQIVRHPGPVLRSFHSLSTNDPYTPSRSLEDLIEGHVPSKTWNAYHQHWQEVAESLGNRYALVHYEAVTKNPLVLCDAIQRLTGLRYQLPQDVKSFEQFHAKDPVYYGFGTNRGWESYFTPEQVARIYDINAPMMKRFGYLEASEGAAQ